MNQEKQGKKMGQVISKAWADDAFKQRLLNDPEAVLKEEGVEIPEGVEVRVVENTDKIFYLLLPPRPLEAELSEAQLAAASGGDCGAYDCSHAHY
jgi:hypothetical protein